MAAGEETRHEADESVVDLVASFLDQQAKGLHRRLSDDVVGIAVTVSIQGRPRTIGSSTELAFQVDQTQYRIGEGACLTALRQGVTSYVTDLANDPRWPTYGPAAARLGARSCLSTPVWAGDAPIGAVKAYAGTVDGLTEGQRQLTRQFATEVTGAFALAAALAERDEELADRVAAMERRRTIDLALGIVMQRQACSAEAAFELLRARSQQANVKLRDVAEQLVRSVAPEETATSPFRARGVRPRP